MSFPNKKGQATLGPFLTVETTAKGDKKVQMSIPETNSSRLHKRLFKDYLEHAGLSDPRNNRGSKVTNLKTQTVQKTVRSSSGKLIANVNVPVKKSKIEKPVGKNVYKRPTETESFFPPSSPIPDSDSQPTSPELSFPIAPMLPTQPPSLFNDDTKFADIINRI